MSDSVFKHLQKKGIIVPEHQIQPVMSQWDAYKIITNNANPEKLAGHTIGHKFSPEEPRIQ
ncbi:hypothetical protein FAY30_04950 [Bacillus sp. S3]|uniref:hypothetical protein n=1 Tax=Bacillus sp. S3 TaxID=486398 RepID=UPI00118D1082|nr:hypothetical protein [Bacillus sp. S3]QCJ41294.1 hypothetical protein FAY30_04950 [Bacillus sp. S3]